MISHQKEEKDNEDEGLIKKIDKKELENYVNSFDLKRLEQYSKNMVDFHLILDIVPTISKLFFNQIIFKPGVVNLSFTQAAILIGMGLQYKKVEQISRELNLQIELIMS